MNIIKIIFFIIAVSLIASLLFEVLNYLFGADKVFFIGLFSIPFLLVWCILTDKSIDKKRNLDID